MSYLEQVGSYLYLSQLQPPVTSRKKKKGNTLKKDGKIFLSGEGSVLKQQHLTKDRHFKVQFLHLSSYLAFWPTHIQIPSWFL